MATEELTYWGHASASRCNWTWVDGYMSIPIQYVQVHGRSSRGRRMAKLDYFLQDQEGYLLRHELVVGIEWSWPTWRLIMIFTKQYVQLWCGLRHAPLWQVMHWFLTTKPVGPFTALFLPLGSVSCQVPEDGWFVGRLWSWCAGLLQKPQLQTHQVSSGPIELG